MANPITFESLRCLLIAWLILSVLSFVISRQATNLSKQRIVGVLCRLMLAWVLLSILGFMFANQLMALFLPSVSWMIGLLQHDYSATLMITDQNGGRIELLSTLVQPIPPLVPGDSMNTYSKAMHFVISLVLIYSIVAAWPLQHIKSRIMLFLLSIPFSFIFVTVIMSIQLLAVNENTFQSLATQYHIVREKPFYLAWMQGIQNGGGWLRSIALAILGSAILPRSRLKPEDENLTQERKRTETNEMN
jgi:hypothetical protein